MLQMLLLLTKLGSLLFYVFSPHVSMNAVFMFLLYRVWCFFFFSMQQTNFLFWNNTIAECFETFTLQLLVFFFCRVQKKIGFRSGDAAQPLVDSNYFKTLSLVFRLKCQNPAITVCHPKKNESEGREVAQEGMCVAVFWHILVSTVCMYLRTYSTLRHRVVFCVVAVCKSSISTVEYSFQICFNSGDPARFIQIISADSQKATASFSDRVWLCMWLRVIERRRIGWVKGLHFIT